MTTQATKNFENFISSVDPNYLEICELYRIASRDTTRSSLFRTMPSQGNSGDMLIEYLPNRSILRLSAAAASYFPAWLITEKMRGMDVDAFEMFEHEREKESE